MKRLAIILMMLCASYLFADVWQLKVKVDGKWKTQNISKEEFVQLIDDSSILSIYESVDNTKVNIKNYSKTVSYEISTATLPGVERARLIHYYQNKETKHD